MVMRLHSYRRLLRFSLTWQAAVRIVNLSLLSVGLEAGTDLQVELAVVPVGGV